MIMIMNLSTAKTIEEYSKALYIKLKQEPITRNLQLPYIRVTAFSQTDLFLV